MTPLGGLCVCACVPLSLCGYADASLVTWLLPQRPLLLQQALVLVFVLMPEHCTQCLVHFWRGLHIHFMAMRSTPMYRQMGGWRDGKICGPEIMSDIMFCGGV